MNRDKNRVCPVELAGSLDNKIRKWKIFYFYLMAVSFSWTLFFITDAWLIPKYASTNFPRFNRSVWTYVRNDGTDACQHDNVKIFSE